MELLGQLNDLEKSYEGFEDLDCSPVHAALTKRMRKTLYAGRVDAEGISLPLTEIVVELFENADQGHLGQLSKRHVANLTRRANATQCSLFLSMMYTKRLQESNPDYITRIKPAELFLVSMMIATKFLYDEGEEEELYNDEWANAAKIDVNRVHDLEHEFLDAIDWRLLIDPLDFYEFLLGIETRIALRESRKRGWLTYTDLSVLMQLPAWYQACCTLLENTLKVISVCTLVYGLCTAVTVWSVLLMQQAQLQPPPRPTNGCLPLPLGPHRAKSTEPSHLGSPSLPDLLPCLNRDLEVEVEVEATSLNLDVLAPQVDLSHCCSLLQDENPSECLCLRLSAEAAGQSELGGSCWCPLESRGPGVVDGGLEGCRDCCCPASSWSQTLGRLAAGLERLHQTLVTFYGAVLTAWSEIPPGTPEQALMDSIPKCADCHPDPPSTANSTEGASGEELRRGCGGTREAGGCVVPAVEGMSPHEARPAACPSFPSGERWLLPQFLASDHSVGFATRSEILVTM